MKYAIFNDGFPGAFYSEDVNGGDIPAEATSITEDQWRELIDNAGRRRWVNGAVVAYEPPPIEPMRPDLVFAAQAKIALHNAGLLDQVKTAVAAHPYEPVRIWFESAGTWERWHPYLQALGLEIGLDDEAIDALFVAASKI